MLHRRPPSTSSSVPIPPPPRKAQNPSENTSYTPLKRRESANLYPDPSSSSKPRYPLPSPDISPYPNNQLGTSNTLGLSSPIHFTNRSYGGYEQTGGPGYGTGNTFDLSGDRPDQRDMGERIMSGIRLGLDRGWRGVEDALRLDRSWNMVWNDAELKLLILKSSMINLLSLLLLSFFSIVVSPSLGSAISDSSRTREIGMWYNLLLSWPVFAVCFWINASWGPSISRRAQTLLHPSYRHQPSPSSTPLKTSTSLPSVSLDASSFLSPIFKGLARVLLIADFTLVSRVISMVPLVGWILGFGYMSIITSFYCFEWNFSSKGWTLGQRVMYVQERLAYMVGFGLLPTLLTSLSTPLINMSIFALLYPFFVIQALLSRPPVPRSSHIPSTPSPGGGSLAQTPTESHAPFFTGSGIEGKGALEGLKREGWVPLFVGARYGLQVLGWFEGALGRQMGRKGERTGKRLG